MIVCILEEKLREVQLKECYDGVVNLRDSVPRTSKLSSRINITVSVPALNYSFPVNQPENGNSRLIIVLINSKVSVGYGSLTFNVRTSLRRINKSVP